MSGEGRDVDYLDLHGDVYPTHQRDVVADTFALLTGL